MPRANWPLRSSPSDSSERKFELAVETLIYHASKARGATPANFSTQYRIMQYLAEDPKDRFMDKDMAISLFEIKKGAANNALGKLHDSGICYIDRWKKNKGYGYSPIYCLGIEEDAPKPHAEKPLFERKARSKQIREKIAEVKTEPFYKNLVNIWNPRLVEKELNHEQH